MRFLSLYAVYFLNLSSVAFQRNGINSVRLGPSRHTLLIPSNSSGAGYDDDKHNLTFSLFKHFRKEMEESMEGLTYYELLGVDATASEEEITKGYRQEALKHHPDRVPIQKKLEATQRFQKISEAYETLSNPERKREYDACLRSGKKFTPHNNTEEDAETRFNEEFADLMKETMEEIRLQAAEGDRTAPTITWGLMGGIAGGVLGSIFFAPAIIPLVVVGGLGGSVKGYTNSDMVTVTNNISPAIKAKILKMMYQKLTR